ncbi:MAG: helix-turn-helix domain-containing protein, partial [Pseudomonadota bacterium]
AFLLGNTVYITYKYFLLATCYLVNIVRILSRLFLLDAVWGVSTDLNTRTVDVHISRVRKALAITPASGFRIKTIYQHGYRLERIDQV